jgi:hypothetical protein
VFLQLIAVVMFAIRLDRSVRNPGQAGEGKISPENRFFRAGQPRKPGVSLSRAPPHKRILTDQFCCNTITQLN